jgi:hypothetical protein
LTCSHSSLECHACFCHCTVDIGEGRHGE